MSYFEANPNANINFLHIYLIRNDLKAWRDTQIRIFLFLYLSWPKLLSNLLLVQPIRESPREREARGNKIIGRSNERVS